MMMVLFFRLCDEYEKIAEKALTSPANTEHLMELMVSHHTNRECQVGGGGLGGHVEQLSTVTF
jgi:hypothetical protein